MRQTKVFGINDTDFFQFIKKINEFYSSHGVFATQTHLSNGMWFAIIYFESEAKNG